MITHWYQASNSFSKKAVHAHTFQNSAATTVKFPEPFQPADISQRYALRGLPLPLGQLRKTKCRLEGSKANRLEAILDF